ncbi:MAG TPA: methanogen output domain 1-containing protein [Gammaproteobacteria bacterium]|nr:methanogen output domain 1-containing protein [Gammaproteobacteria bacterium]
MAKPTRDPAGGAGAPPEIAIPLERDLFLRRLLRELTGALEEVVGLEEASGFISLVGQHIAEWLEPAYREAYGVEALDAAQVARTLVDLKARIQGDFRIEECTPERIVLVNGACPFGEQVVGRTSHCMMTSTVFGTIAAESLGYAKVALKQTIAQGDPGCRVVIYLREDPELADQPGIEYFGA